VNAPSENEEMPRPRRERPAQLGTLVELEAALDLHVHSWPCLFPRLQDDLDLAASYQAARFAGFALKSHHESTASRAYLLGQLFPELTVVGGITLNRPVGGLNPSAVAACLATGGRIVWMPTIDAQAHREAAGSQDPHAGHLEAPSQPGLSILDPDGRLLASVLEILDLIREADAVLATGHLSAGEVAALVPAAREWGVERVIVTHPLFRPPGLGLDALAELVQSGVYAEFTYTTSSPMWNHATLAETRLAIGRLGAERCILTSDAGQRHNPAGPEGLRVFAQSLYELGLTEAELDLMLRRNPRQLLRLPTTG
jgi:hypothetical protein